MKVRELFMNLCEHFAKLKKLLFAKYCSWIIFNPLKGGGHGKIYSEFIVYIFSLGSIKTHDTIFKIFGIR